MLRNRSSEVRLIAGPIEQVQWPALRSVDQITRIGASARRPGRIGAQIARRQPHLYQRLELYLHPVEQPLGLGLNHI